MKKEYKGLRLRKSLHAINKKVTIIASVIVLLVGIVVPQLTSLSQRADAISASDFSDNAVQSCPEGLSAYNFSIRTTNNNASMRISIPNQNPDIVFGPLAKDTTYTKYVCATADDVSSWTVYSCTNGSGGGNCSVVKISCNDTSCIISDVQYTVRHLDKNTNQPISSNDSLSGIIGQQTSATCKSVEGYTCQTPITQKTINANTVVDVYYTSAGTKPTVADIKYDTTYTGAGDATPTNVLDGDAYAPATHLEGYTTSSEDKAGTAGSVNWDFKNEKWVVVPTVNNKREVVYTVDSTNPNTPTPLPRPSTPPATAEPTIEPEEEPEEEILGVSTEKTTKATDVLGDTIKKDDDTAWALLNLILTILTALGTLTLLITFFRKKDDKEDETKTKRHGALRALSFIPTLGAIIIFILTENMNNPMRFVDKWTLLMFLIALVQFAMMWFSRKTLKDNKNTKSHDKYTYIKN
jgi:hypothetical protein